jgi:hypothetical protein
MKNLSPPKGHSDSSDAHKLSAEEDSTDSLILTAHFYSNPERPMCPNQGLLQALAQSSGSFPEELLQDIGIHLNDCPQCDHYYHIAKAQHKASYLAKLLSVPRHLIEFFSNINSATPGRNNGLLVLRFGLSATVAVAFLLAICAIFLILSLKQQSLKDHFTSASLNSNSEELLSTEPLVKDHEEIINPPQIKNDRSKRSSSNEHPTTKPNPRTTLSFVLDSKFVTRGPDKKEVYRERQTNDIRIPNTKSMLRLICNLPDGSKRGGYDVQISIGLSKVVFKERYISSNGKNLIFFCSDKYFADGNYIISLSPEGESPIIYEISVERQKR